MKRTNTFAILAMLVFGMTLTLSGCKKKETAHEHTFSKEWSTSAIEHWHASSCGHDVKDTVEVHTFGKWEVETPATCVDKGKEKRTCFVCGYIQTRDINPGGHHFSETWSHDGTSHWYECDCGEKVDEGNHEGGTAYCTQKAVCATCGTEYGDFNLNNHLDEDNNNICDLCEEIFVSLTIDQAKEATIKAGKSVFFNINFQKNGDYEFQTTASESDIEMTIKNASGNNIDSFSCDSNSDFIVLTGDVGIATVEIKNNGLVEKTLLFLIHKHVFGNDGQCGICEKDFTNVGTLGQNIELFFNQDNNAFVYYDEGDINSGDYFLEISDSSGTIIDLDFEIYANGDYETPFANTKAFTLSASCNLVIKVIGNDSLSGKYYVNLIKNSVIELKAGINLVFEDGEQGSFYFALSNDDIYVVNGGKSSLAIVMCDYAEIISYTTAYAEQYYYFEANRIYYFNYEASDTGNTDLIFEIIEERTYDLLSDDGLVVNMDIYDSYVYWVLVDETGYYHQIKSEEDLTVSIINIYPDRPNYYLLDNDSIALVKLDANADLEDAVVKLELVPNKTDDLFGTGFSENMKADSLCYVEFYVEIEGTYEITTSGSASDVSIYGEGSNKQSESEYELNEGLYLLEIYAPLGIGIRTVNLALIN